MLLVDASEGPLSQTKFVVEKALKRGLKCVRGWGGRRRIVREGAQE